MCQRIVLLCYRINFVVDIIVLEYSLPFFFFSSVSNEIIVMVAYFLVAYLYLLQLKENRTFLCDDWHCLGVIYLTVSIFIICKDFSFVDALTLPFNMKENCWTSEIKECFPHYLCTKYRVLLYILHVLHILVYTLSYRTPFPCSCSPLKDRRSNSNFWTFVQGCSQITINKSS